MIRGIIFGCWDLFHVGHLRALLAASKQCDVLYIGIFSDEVIKDYKGHFPIISYLDRYLIIANLSLHSRIIPFGMNHRSKISLSEYHKVFVSDKLRRYAIIPDDYGGEIVQLPYDKSTSTTKIKEKIKNES